MDQPCGMPVVTAVPAVTAAAQLLFANTLEVAFPTQEYVLVQTRT